MKTKTLVVLVLLVVAAKYTYEDSKFTVAENEQVVLVYRSGDPSKVVHAEPGEYFKLPFIQEKIYYGKQINALNVEQQILTKDYKIVNFGSTANWKIFDPVLFYKSLNSLSKAGIYINEQIIGVERKVIPNYKLAELTPEPNLSEYKNTNCSEDLSDKVLEGARKRIADVGIELVDVKINISYPTAENVVGQP
jgi:membrane protease subunit HflC